MQNLTSVKNTKKRNGTFSQSILLKLTKGAYIKSIHCIYLMHWIV